MYGYVCKPYCTKDAICYLVSKKLRRLKFDFAFNFLELSFNLIFAYQLDFPFFIAKKRNQKC